MTRLRGAKYSVGIVGVGAIVLDIHLPVLLNRKDVRVLWVADIARPCVDKARSRFRVDAILIESGNLVDLPDVDAILLAAPVGARESYHRELTQRRSRIFLEKPFARTRDEARSIVSAYAGHTLICGFQRRHHPAFRKLRVLTNSGEFGAVKRIVVREGSRTMATGRSSDFRDNAAIAGGGILMDLGCHGIDLAFQLTESTSAEILEQRVLFDGGIDRDVSLRARMVGGPSEVELRVELSWLRELGREFRVEFERGALHVGTQPQDRLIVTRAQSEVNPEDLVLSPGPATTWEAISAMWSILLPEHGQPAACPNPTGYLPTVDLIEAIYTNARR
ncbi:MAG: Gfo/Idh/MocA family oxidoreductase [Actinomycetota bacterium]